MTSRALDAIGGKLKIAAQEMRSGRVDAAESWLLEARDFLNREVDEEFCEGFDEAFDAVESCLKAIRENDPDALCLLERWAFPKFTSSDEAWLAHEAIRINPHLFEAAFPPAPCARYFGKRRIGSDHPFLSDDYLEPGFDPYAQAPEEARS